MDVTTEPLGSQLTDIASPYPVDGVEDDGIEFVPIKVDTTLASLNFEDDVEKRTLTTPLGIKTGSSGGVRVLSLGRFVSASQYPFGYSCHVKFYDYEDSEKQIWYHAEIDMTGRYVIRPLHKENPREWVADASTTMFKLLAADCNKGGGSYSLSGPRKMGLNHPHLTNLFQEMFAVDMPGKTMSSKSTVKKKKRKADEDDWSTSQYDSPDRPSKRSSRVTTSVRRDRQYELHDVSIPEFQLETYSQTSQLESDDETEDGQWRFQSVEPRLPTLHATADFYLPETIPLPLATQSHRPSARTEAAQALSCMTAHDHEAISALQGLASAGAEQIEVKLFTDVSHSALQLNQSWRQSIRRLDDVFYGLWQKFVEAGASDSEECRKLQDNMTLLIAKVENAMHQRATPDSDAGTRIN